MDEWNELHTHKNGVHLQFYHPLALAQLVYIFSGEKDGLAAPNERPNGRKYH